MDKAFLASPLSSNSPTCLNNVRQCPLAHTSSIPTSSEHQLPTTQENNKARHFTNPATGVLFTERKKEKNLTMPYNNDEHVLRLVTESLFKDEPAPSKPEQQKQGMSMKVQVLIHIALFTTLAFLFSPLDLVVNPDACSCQTPKPDTHLHRFDGTFDRSSPFKGPPSPEVIAEWDKIIPLNMMRIPESEFATLNASPHAVKIPEKNGGGRVVMFEAIHMLHCVKSLYQSTYPSYFSSNPAYYTPTPSSTEEEAQRAYIDHCADMLRQKLMCDADRTLITFKWVDGLERPQPDFDVLHKCRDFGGLVEEVGRRSIDVPLRGEVEGNE
ncbi:unnamed protein product [Periconia digitata]|uniref:Uncharacterized protein n=1 Tax=Periconia digitata TaxID=1303443 RepID=A0A9W4UE14_9PLEO|nr:unnamed protein product [Periconia digitata]